VRRFVAVRLLHAIVVLLLVTTVAFFLIHLAPGDPLGGEDSRLSEAMRQQLRAQFGYDRPIAEQYVRYVANVFRGELGFSHSLHAPVSEVLAATLPRTLLLMSIALTLGFALGMWLGVFEVRHWRTRIARATNAASLVVYSFPDFWFALMLLLAFAYWIPILPAGGIVDVVMHDYMSPGRAAWDRIRHLILPVTALSVMIAAMIARYQRAALLDVLPSDFVRTARAKGVDDRAVIAKHALRNALLPMITLVGIALPSLLGGAVFVERVFSWPGMGLTAVNAVAARDYPLVMATVLVGAAMVALGNLIADVAYGVADPRVRVR
jgi:peptide/nickel transport system permease protein